MYTQFIISTQISILIIAACIVGLIVMNRLLINENELIKKAEKNWFYHVLAKMTSPKYDGYKPSNEEKKAMEEYLSEPSAHDTHPIGGYFRLCDSLKSTLSTCGNFHNYKLNFNMGEVGIGVCVMLVFGIIVTLGCIYG